jgi:radical SAM protein with 4Fe4S-binding SPASM domain
MEHAVQPNEAAENELHDPGVAPKTAGKTAGYEKAFCRAAFESLHVAIGGSAKPCCEFKGEIGSLKETSLEGLWHSESLKDLRAKMLRGERDAGCRKCYDAEDAGGVSLRNWYNAGDKLNSDFDERVNLANPILRTLDIRFSNLCNLSCRTCGPDASTKWYADAKHLNWWKLDAHALNETFTSKSAALEALGPALETIEGIYFAGGEPLLHEGHYAVLQDLIDRGRTDVLLNYNTNLSELRLGKLEVLPFWSKFKNVSIGASIDGHQRQGELIREGLSWDKFAANVATVRERCPHVDIYFAITVSVFNILSLPLLCQHLRAIDPIGDAQFRFNLLLEPDHYNIQLLPALMKEDAARRLKSFAEEFALQEQIKPVIDYMMFQDRPDQIEQFRSTTQRLDELRNQNTAKIIPELAPLLRESPPRKLKRLAKGRLRALAQALSR